MLKLIFFILFFSIYSCLGQNRMLPFILDGSFFNFHAINNLTYSIDGGKENKYQEVKDGKFIIKGKVSEPKKISIKLNAEGKSIKYNFYIEPKKRIIFTAQYGSSLFKLKNSKIYSDKQNLDLKKNTIQQRIDEIDNEQLIIKDNPKYYENYKITLMDSLRKLDSLFILNNPSSFYAAILLNNYLNVPRLLFNFQSFEKIYEAYPVWIKKTSLGIYLKTHVDLQTILNKKAPNFFFKDAQNKITNLEEFSLKKATLLCFSATWCIPCASTETDLNKLNNFYKFRNRLNIISVYCDDDSLKWENHTREIAWITILDKNGLSISKPNSIFSTYHIQTLPTLILINSQGVIVKIFKKHSYDDISNYLLENEKILGLN